MKKNNKSPSEFAINNKLLTVDLNVLNLLQMALITLPTEKTAVKLKRQFGLYYLSPQEILRELSNLYSPLRKFLVSLMMCMVARCLMLMNERSHHMIEQENKLAEMELEEILEEQVAEKKQHKTDARVPLLRKELMRWDRIVSNILLVTSLPLQPFTQAYLLDAFKANQLSYYLGIASPEIWDFVRDIIEQNFRMAKRDLNEIARIRVLGVLTPEKKNQLNEVEERYLQSLEYQSNPSILAKILPHINFTDPSVISLQLWKNLVKNQSIVHELKTLVPSISTKINLIRQLRHQAVLPLMKTHTSM